MDVPRAQLEDVLAALPEHLSLTRAESGNERFSVTPAESPPGRLWVSETFRDRSAFEAHQARARASSWGALTAGLPRTYFFIRRAERADRDDLAALYLACRRQTFSWVDPAAYALTDFDADTDGEHVLVCEREGQVVGFAGLSIGDNFLHHLFVHDTHQGHGAGRGLLRAAQSCASGPLRLKCVVRNERAQRFYQRLGGVITATQEGGLEGAHHVILLLDQIRG